MYVRENSKTLIQTGTSHYLTESFSFFRQVLNFRTMSKKLIIYKCFIFWHLSWYSELLYFCLCILVCWICIHTTPNVSPIPFLNIYFSDLSIKYEFHKHNNFLMHFCTPPLIFWICNKHLINNFLLKKKF